MSITPCINHPFSDAAATCVNCGRPFCDACLVEFLGQRHCGPCRDQKLGQLQAAGGTATYADARFAGTGTVDIGRWLSLGWSHVSSDVVTYAMAALLMGLVSLASCGIAGGAMQVGMVMLTYRKMSYGRVEVGNLFDGFRRFGNAFLATLLIVIASFALRFVLELPGLGIMLAVDNNNSGGASTALQLVSQLMSMAAGIIASAVVGGATFFVYPHLAARNGDAIDAFKVSWMVFRRNPVMFMVAAVVIQLVAGLGVIACFIGVLVTGPVAIAARAQAYADHFGIEGWDLT